MVEEQMRLVIDGWPVLIDSIKLVNNMSDIQLEWRMDTENEHFPDITSMTIDQINEVKEHLGSRLVAVVASDMAAMTGKGEE